MKQTFPIHGIDCVSCATIVKNKSLKLTGITSCYVDVENKTVEYEYNEKVITPEQINTELEKYGYNLTLASDAASSKSAHSNEDFESKKLKQNLIISIPLVSIALIDMIWMIGGNYGRLNPMSATLSEFIHHLLPILATIMLFIVGPKYLLAVGRYFRHGTASMDTLVWLGTTVAYIYSFIVTAFADTLKPYLDTELVYYEAVIVVIGFIALGKYIEHRTMAKSWEAIKALLNLQAKKAIRVNADLSEQEIDIEQLIQGDTIRIKPGEKVPLDAIITSWSSDIDESMISWESIPVTKTIDNEIIWWTLNLNGSLIARITATSNTSYLSKIIKAVTLAQQSRPAIQWLVDKIMTWFIPLVFSIAIGSALLWFLFWEYISSKYISIAIASFIGVLVIACPCGIGLATPMAVTTGVWHLAKNGILSKNAEALLKLRKATTFIFDKTGTLTQWKPEVVYINNKNNLSNLWSILYAIESQATHPLATAVSDYFSSQKDDSLIVTDFLTLPWYGVQAKVDNILYHVVSPNYLDKQSITYDASEIQKITEQWYTPVLLIENNSIILAVLWLADTIKTHSKETIEKLHKMGHKTVMISWDHKAVATHIAKQLGIDEYYAEIKPEAKAELIRKISGKEKVCDTGCCPSEIKTTKNDNFVVMVGDGINDAPALAQADIGIAMSTGTDIAIESADMTLLHGDISKILKAIEISKLTHSAIAQNLFWAFSYNIIGIPLAAWAFFPLFGRLLNPAFEGAAMAMSDLMVIANSIRLQNKKI